MLNANLVRFEDRENILKTVLQNHNYAQFQPLFSFRRRLNSSLSIRSDKADFDRKIQLLQTPRRSSGSIKKFVRRGSSTLFKPSRTNSFNNQQNIFNDDVSNFFIKKHRHWKSKISIFPIFRNKEVNLKWSWTCQLKKKLCKMKACSDDCRSDAKVLQSWLVKLIFSNNQLLPLFDWWILWKFRISSKSPSRYDFCLFFLDHALSAWITMKWEGRFRRF